MYSIQEKPPIQTSCDLDSGLISDKLKRQLDLVGITVKQHFEDFATNHIINVAHELQNNGSYQSDFDFYLNGGESLFTLTLEEAKAFLNDEYNHRMTLLPKTNGKEVDAILCNGIKAESVVPTLEKRLAGLEESILVNDKYRNVYVICKDTQLGQLAKIHIESTFQKKYKDVHFVYVVTDAVEEIGVQGIKKISEEESMLKNYVVATDPTSMEKDWLVAKDNLPEGYTCLGITAKAQRDWVKAMNAYSYEEKLGSKEKATIAWAKTEWIFIARRAHKESALFQKRHAVQIK